MVHGTVRQGQVPVPGWAHAAEEVDLAVRERPTQTDQRTGGTCPVHIEEFFRERLEEDQAAREALGCRR
jgi:hypothetical protein